MGSVDGAGGGAQVHLNPLPEALQGADVTFLGPKLPAREARGIAYGYLHPHPPHAAFPDAHVAKQVPAT